MLSSCCGTALQVSIIYDKIRVTEMSRAEEAVLFVGVFWVSRSLLRWWKSKERVKPLLPPSLPSLPLVGSLPFIIGFDNLAKFFMRKADELGPVFTFRVGNKLILTLNSREVIDEALVKQSYAFSGRDPIYTEGIVNPNTKGLSSMNTSPEWKKYHQISLSILREFGFGVKSTMEARILMEVEAITEYVQKKNGETINPKDLLLLAASNVINNIVFGRRRDYGLGASELAYQAEAFFEGMDIAFDVAPVVRFIPYYKKKLSLHVNSVRRMQDIFDEEVEESLKHGAADSFVRRYIEKLGSDYDREQLNFTLRDLVTAGIDTSKNTILWFLVMLANFPEVQERLQKEIDDVVPRDRLPSAEYQSRLPFVQACIMELMRWKMLAIISIARLTLNDSTVGGYFIPKGTQVWPNLYAVHMDPKVWKDPDVFRPERFLDDKNNVIDSNRVIPFGTGRRSCLGEVLARLQIFLIITGLLQRCTIRPPDGQTRIDVKTIIGVLAVPAPFKVRMIPRT